MEEFLRFVIGKLVEFPEEMLITSSEDDRKAVFRVRLRKSDVGKVIGRNGQVIKAIRQLLSAAASRHNKRAILEIEE
jgi:predicted RNA-binding protein YlqC (UPF0109 family)